MTKRRAVQGPKPIECDTCGSQPLNPICSVKSLIPIINEKKRHMNRVAGQSIFAEGETPTGLFLVREGIVRLESHSADGAVRALRLYGPGQALGYRSLFSKSAYTAHAVAVTDVVLCFLKSEDVQSLLESDPQAALNMLSCLSADLKIAEDKWIHQIERSAKERLAEAILFLTDHFGEQTWSRREIAEWAGTTTETAIRTLIQFEEQKLIAYSGRRILVTDRSALLQLSLGQS